MVSGLFTFCVAGFVGGVGPGSNSRKFALCNVLRQARGAKC